MHASGRMSMTGDERHARDTGPLETKALDMRDNPRALQMLGCCNMVTFHSPKGGFFNTEMLKPYKQAWLVGVLVIGAGFTGEGHF